MHAGDPAAIEGLAEAFHTAGGHVQAADDEFARAREQFKTAYSRENGSQHPINDSAEVQKITAVLADHPGALATVAVSLEQIAAGLAEAQRAATAEIDELNTALLSIDAELSTAAVPLLILNLLKEADEQTKMSLGILEKIQGTYALQLHTEQTTMQASGYGAEAIGAADGVDAIDHYLKVVYEKTACLISASGRFGATFSGADDDQIERLARLGGIVGTAFQISDDIIDIDSDPDESGKLPGTDLREGVHTLPVLYALQDTGADADRLRVLLAGPVTEDAAVEEALGLLRASAGMVKAKQTVADYAARARAELAALPDCVGRSAMAGLVDYTVNRHG